LNKKDYNYAITDSPPLSVIQQLVSEKVPSEISLTIERYIMESTNSYKNGIPQFDGHKYVFWSIRMKTYIQAHGFQVWQSIVDGYTKLIVTPTNDKAVKFGENNSKDEKSLLNGLSDTVFTKVAHCKSAKEIWDKLQNIYEGDSKVKAAKLQTYRGRFRGRLKQLKMKEDEDITAYFL
jgi:hypothetical protein